MATHEATGTFSFWWKILTKEYPCTYPQRKVWHVIVSSILNYYTSSRYYISTKNSCQVVNKTECVVASDALPSSTQTSPPKNNDLILARLPNNWQTVRTPPKTFQKRKKSTTFSILSWCTIKIMQTCLCTLDMSDQNNKKR